MKDNPLVKELEEKLAKEKQEKEKQEKEKQEKTTLEDAPVQQEEEVQDLNTIIDEELEKLEETNDINTIVEEALKESNEEIINEESFCKCKYYEDIINKLLHSKESGSRVINELKGEVTTQSLHIRDNQISTREDIINARNANKALHAENNVLLKSINKHISRWFISVLIIACFSSFVIGAIAWENKETIKENGKPFMEFVGFLNKAKIGEQ